ncbi:MAG: glutathione synthase, partial [Candidatus Competibacterales bacterium]
MTVRLGVVMDPIDAIKPHKDTTLALLLAAQRRGWSLLYFEPVDLFLRDGRAQGLGRPLVVADDPKAWYRLEAPEELDLVELDVILMRVDPPFNMEYI